MCIHDLLLYSYGRSLISWWSFPILTVDVVQWGHTLRSELPWWSDQMTSHDPHRQHPPGVPYTGGYLENIWAIDNGQNTFTPEGLVNFAKMTAVSLIHTICTLFGKRYNYLLKSWIYNKECDNNHPLCLYYIPFSCVVLFDHFCAFK